MGHQTIIERAMIKQYCQKQKEEKAARGIKPGIKEMANKAANDQLAIRFKVGYK